MLIWGNHEYCAFDLVHPWYTQKLRKFGEIIHGVNTQSINGTYLCALLENIKLEWCSSQPLTAIPPTLDALITDCSLKTTYQTLRGWKITLTDSLPNLLLFREHDQLLGDVLTPQTSSALTPSELLLVKQVRMFAGYTTLSQTLSLQTVFAYGKKHGICQSPETPTAFTLTTGLQLHLG